MKRFIFLCALCVFYIAVQSGNTGAAVTTRTMPVNDQSGTLLYGGTLYGFYPGSALAETGTQQEPAADTSTIRAVETLLYRVTAVILIGWFAIAGYLFTLDRKVRRIERNAGE